MTRILNKYPLGLIKYIDFPPDLIINKVSAWESFYENESIVTLSLYHKSLGPFIRHCRSFDEIKELSSALEVFLNKLWG